MYPSTLALVTLHREDKPACFPLEIWDTSYIVTVIICHEERFVNQSEKILSIMMEQTSIQAECEA